MKLLVTGGCGFIGRRTAEVAHERGHSVRVLVRPRAAARAPAEVEVVEGDIRDEEALGRALDRVTAVIHCAASLTGGVDEQRDVTVGGTRALVAALRSSSCRRVVGVGTFANYDVAALEVGATLDESSPTLDDARGRHPYLAAKAEQERILAALGAEEGWTVHVLCPGLVHGEGRLWFHHIGARLGPLWLLFSPDARLPLVSVDECALALARAAERSDSIGGPVNVVGDDLPTRREWARTVAERESVRPVIVGIPWPVVSFPARILSATVGRILPLPDVLRLDALSERCKPLLYSNARLRAELG